jgi:hypothetical protein
MVSKLTNYQLRALNELSHRSPNLAKMNVQTLKNKKNRNVLTKVRSNIKTRRQQNRKNYL